MKQQSGHDFAMWILDFLAPGSCVFCGSASDGNEKSVCVGCFADLPWCEAAISPTPGVLHISIAMLHYSFPIDVAIKALKFDRRLHYAPALAEILCAGCAYLPSGIDAVLAVPLHWRRKAFRGFNQATEIAKPVAKTLGVPMRRLVRRSKATPFQSGLDAADRARNLKQAFSVRPSMVPNHVLIIDDVITTGATVQQLAKVLLAYRVQTVSALILARAD